MKSKPRWTREECGVLLSSTESNKSEDWLDEISLKVRSVSGVVRSHDAIRSKLRSLQISPDKDVAVEWPDKKESKVDWRESLKAADEAVARHHKASSSQDVATVQITTSEPIAICYSSDWHLGSVCTNHASLVKHIEYIINTDNLYMISNGDERDNMQIFRNVAARAQSLPIGEQAKVFAAIYHELCDNNKLLCAGYGNHSEEFEERNVGYSYSAMVKGSRIPYFRGMGRLFVEVGPDKNSMISYEHIMSHEGKGNSQHNPLYGVTKQAWMYGPLSDVSVASHTHNPAFSYSFGHGLLERKQAATFPIKPRVDIKTGTFKIYDPHSQRYFGQGRIGIPTIVFLPSEKRMIPFETPEFAMAFIKGYKRL